MCEYMYLEDTRRVGREANKRKGHCNSKQQQKKRERQSERK